MKARLDEAISKISPFVLLAAILIIIGVVVDVAIFSLMNWHYTDKLNALTFEKATGIVKYSVTDITPYHYSNGATEFQVRFGDPTDGLSNFDIIVPNVGNIQKGSIWEVKETTYACAQSNDSLTRRVFQFEHETLTNEDIKQFQEKARSDYKNYLDNKKSSDKFCTELLTGLPLLALYLIVWQHLDETEEHAGNSVKAQKQEVPHE